MTSKRSSSRFSGLLVALLAALLMTSVMGATNSSAAPEPRGEVQPAKVKTWSKLNVPSPNNPAGMHNELLDIDCDGVNCTAIGLWGPSQDVSKPTVLRLRGKKATARAIPGIAVGNLARAISCIGQKWCMVVGNTHKDDPADLTWSILMSNNKWKTKATVTPSNGAGGQAYLFDVKCISTKNCVAVGHYFDPSANMRGLVQRWNGKTWKRILNSKFAGASLQGVDCTSTKNCVAVGSTTKGAAGWRIRSGKVSKIAGSGPATSRFNRVDCVTDKWCGVAGGNIDDPMPVQINGSRWSRVGLGTNSRTMEDMSDISCSAVKRCTVSAGWKDSKGFAHSAVWRWKGNSRKMIKMSGTATTVGELNSVDCQPLRCVAVGQNYIKGDIDFRLRNTAFQGPPN